MTEEHQPIPSLPNDARAVFVELSKVLLDVRPLTDTLQGITELAKQVIPGTLDVSVTMLDRDQARTVVFTGDLAADLDERQYEAGFGPCMNAARTGESVQIVTSHPEGAYAEFSGLCRAAGVTHVLSVGLPVPGRSVGALNTYAARDEDLDEADVELAKTFATFAAVAIANVATTSGTEHLDEDMRAALQSRTVIEQAMSIWMASRQYSAADAFDSMVQLSKERGDSLQETARAIVDGSYGQ